MEGEEQGQRERDLSSELRKKKKLNREAKPLLSASLQYGGTQ